MKSLKTLVKLNKSELDRLLNYKKDIEENIEYTEATKSKLVEEAKVEIQKYHNTEFAFMLENYLQEHRTKLEKLDDYIMQFKKMLAETEEKIANQFTELKKFEIALDNRKKALDEKEKIAEMKFIDEFNTNKFARKD